MNIDDFDKKYSQDNTIKSEYFEDGRLETFGRDLEQAIKVESKKPRTIWTCIDGDKGTYFVAGLHYVNRIYYIVTKEEWKSSDEEYFIDSSEQG